MESTIKTNGDQSTTGQLWGLKKHVCNFISGFNYNKKLIFTCTAIFTWKTKIKIFNCVLWASRLSNVALVNMNILCSKSSYRNHFTEGRRFITPWEDYEYSYCISESTSDRVKPQGIGHHRITPYAQVQLIQFRVCLVRHLSELHANGITRVQEFSWS